MKNLNVSNKEVIDELNNLSDDKIKIKCIDKISYTRLNRNLKWDFVRLLDQSPIERKKAIFFIINFKRSDEILSYLFRHLLRTSSKYDVPKSIIKNYMDKKDSYKYYIKYGNISNTKEKLRYKKKLHESAKLLMDSTIEMINRQNSRKGKINKIIDKL